MSAPASSTAPVLAGRIGVALSPREARLDPALAGLVERLTEGDTEAMRALAEKLAPRVRRVAQALMGRSPDADDAAQHALIELLRAYPRAGTEQGVEGWADRNAALSVLRFARAVRRRGAQGDAERAPEPEPEDERAGRSFERYLQQLSEPSREVLLLHHALAFRLDELPEALRCSGHAAKERLLDGRRELRALVRRRSGATREPSAAVLRWCALRDREAIADALDASEQEEVAALEASEPALWAYVAQLRALELYFASHVQALQDEDRALIEAALPGVQVTSKAVLAHALEGDDDLERALDVEESGWSRAIAIGGSALLLIGCAVALLLRVPGERSTDRRGGARGSAIALPTQSAAASASATPPLAPMLAPTVEPLTSARVSSRGARFRTERGAIGLGAPVGQGQELEALERPACLTLAASELCLAPSSALRISSLVAREPAVELLRGRLVARALQAQPQPLAVEVASLRTRLAVGALAVERGAEEASARVRAIRGRFAVVTVRGERVLEEGRGLSLVAADGALAVSVLPPAVVQRDLDLVSQAHGGARPAATATSGPIRTAEAPAKESAEPAASTEAAAAPPRVDGSAEEASAASSAPPAPSERAGDGEPAPPN